MPLLILVMEDTAAFDPALFFRHASPPIGRYSSSSLCWVSLFNPKLNYY
jgi:hypothetical protein